MSKTERKSGMALTGSRGDKATQEKIAIIGGGWYGCSLAVHLSSLGMNVTLFEKNTSIFSGVSGNFGVRLHAGPHYPRSEQTRHSCRVGLEEFLRQYPDLVNQHSYSLYALGEQDADGNPSKVSPDTFRSVCEEVRGAVEIDAEKSGYKGTLMVMNIPEPSCVVGKRLRSFFMLQLKRHNVHIHCNTTITSTGRLRNGKEKRISVSSSDGARNLFDQVINATGFQSLLPSENMPFGIQVRYQPCLALMYEDMRADHNREGGQPFSAIEMDGWFPCIMPYDNREEKTKKPSNRYIVTHGKWTIMGSHLSREEALAQLNKVSNHMVDIKIRVHCERELRKFWPEFNPRNFKYLKWKGAVLAKIKTDGEFRSAVTFKHNESGVIYVFPGKITNIFDVQKEVLSLIRERNLTCSFGYTYVSSGVLDGATEEINRKIEKPNTCNLQTYTELSSKKPDIIPYLSGVLFLSIVYYLIGSIKKSVFIFALLKCSYELFMKNSSIDKYSKNIMSNFFISCSSYLIKDIESTQTRKDFERGV